ncbi:MAG: hypothetical protein HY651_04320 [Acidobacteria bacterium]|nr:hypothetical protein [Acidobacteriota bacterium]
MKFGRIGESDQVRKQLLGDFEGPTLDGPTEPDQIVPEVFGGPEHLLINHPVEFDRLHPRVSDRLTALVQ